jgi:hypothetical protein
MKFKIRISGAASVSDQSETNPKFKFSKQQCFGFQILGIADRFEFCLPAQSPALRDEGRDFVLRI